MKRALILSTLVLLSGAHAFAAGTLLKKCEATFSDKGIGGGMKTFSMTVLVSKEKGQLTGSVSISDATGAEAVSGPATFADYVIRADVRSVGTDTEKLNEGEKLVWELLGNQAIAADQEAFDAGMDLSAVRSLRMYKINGGSNLVEAKDGSGRTLGSFFGGYLYRPCNK